MISLDAFSLTLRLHPGVDRFEPTEPVVRIFPKMVEESLVRGRDGLSDTALEGDGIVRSGPRMWLRIEGAVLLALAVFGYARYGESWWLFAILLLVPDVGALGYLVGSRIGGYAYNAVHTYIGPAVLISLGTIQGSSLLLSLGFIWFAHIGMDRAVGYGLKYGDAFGHTHLGMVGKDRRR